MFSHVLCQADVKFLVILCINKYISKFKLGLEVWNWLFFRVELRNIAATFLWQGDMGFVVPYWQVSYYSHLESKEDLQIKHFCSDNGKNISWFTWKNNENWKLFQYWRLFSTMVLTITNLRNKIRDIYSKFIINVFKNLSQCPAISETLYKNSHITD